MIIGSSYELSDHYFSYLGFNFAYLSLEREVFPDGMKRSTTTQDSSQEKKSGVTFSYTVATVLLFRGE